MSSIAIAQPTFTGGTPQTLTVCQNSGANSINALLQISDPNTGSTETWTTFSAPTHGTLVASYTTTSTGSALLPAGLTYAPTAGYAGTDAFTVHVSNGTVTVSTVINVTVTTLPAAIAGTFSVCTGGNAALTDGITGGTWSSAASAVATVGTGGSVSGLSAGTAVITYTKNGCSVTATVTDRNAPTAIVGAASVCVSATTMLTDTSASGTWTSGTTTKATIVAATGVVTGVAAGTVTMTYSTGCGTATTFPIVVVAAPAATITGTLSACSGGGTGIVGNTSVGGTWSTGDATIATNSGNIITGVAVGTTTVTYSTGCGSNVSGTFNVKGSPAAINVPTTSVCVGATITLSDATAGDTWTSAHTSLATVNAAGMVTGVGQGTVTLTYSSGCGTAATTVITVLAVPAASITGTLSECIGANTTLGNTSLGGTWTTSDATIATNNGSVITGISANTVTVTYSTGCGTDVSTVVTVKGSPAAISVPTTSVCVGATITLTDATAGGTWSSGTTSRATVNAAGVVTGIGQGTVTLTYSSGCGTAATTVMTVVAAPAATITGSLSACSGGGTTTLTNASTGGTWSTSDPTIATTNGIVITGISVNTVTVTYSTGCGSAFSTVVTVKGGPAAISGPTSVCAGSTITLTDSIAGGTWSSSATTKGSIGATTGVVTGIAASPVNITYSTGCGSSVTYAIAVIGAPAAITGTATSCVGSGALLSDVTTGGVWSTGNTAVATNNAGTITGVSAGTVTVAYSTGCGSPATTIYTVKGNPANVTGPITVCVGATIAMADSTAGGTWSSSTTKASVGSSTGIVTGVAAGAANIIYNNGCGTATNPITVIAAPAAITGTLIICQGTNVILADATANGTWSTGDTTIATSNAGAITGVNPGTVTVTYSTGCGTDASAVATVKGIPASSTGPTTVCVGSTITLSNTTTNGSWTSSSSTKASIVSSTGVITGVAVGTVNMTYSTGCGTADTYPIIVVGSPAAITGTTSICNGAGIILADGVAGGNWTTSDTTIATNSGSNIIGVAAGTVTVTYSTGCGTDATTVFTVKGTPATTTGPTTVCIGSVITLVNATTGGTWSSSNTPKATVNTVTGVVTGIAAGAANISYTTGCGSTAIYAINTLANPVAITGSTSVFAGSTVTLADASAGGNWSSSNGAVASVSSTGVVSGITSGSVTITYGNGCGSNVNAAMTVNGGPLPITGPTTVCVGTTISLIEGAAGGSWSSSAASKATVSTAGVVTGVAAGALTISYTGGSGSATYAITVIASPAAITGTPTVCVGANTTLANTATGGTWSNSNTAIATNASGVITGIATGTVVITYSTGCGSNATATVTVKDVPASITGATSVCVGSTVLLADSSAGGTWTSGATGRATVVSSTGVVTGVATGTTGVVNITYNNGCGTTTYAMTVLAAPTAISGGTTVCAGADILFTDATAGGNWSTSDTTIASNSSNDVTGVAGGTVTVIYSTGCGTNATKIITVKAAPTAITAPPTVCIGATVTLTDSSAGGTWSSSSSSRASVVSTTGVVSGVGTGSVNITYSNGCGTATAPMTVVGAPAAITGTTNVCPGVDVLLADATVGGTWSTSDPTIASNSGNDITGVTGGTVTVTYNTGCGINPSVIFTVKSAPAAISGPSTVCVGSTITLADTTSAGTWTSSSTTKATVVSTTGVVSGVGAGAVNMTYNTGCGSPATYAITVISSTPAAITGATTVCTGAGIILADATTGGIWSTSNTAIATNSGTNITGVAVGTVTVSYSTTCGSATSLITVKGVPGVITGTTSVCVGSVITLSEAAIGGAWSSSAATKASVNTSGIVTGVAVGTATITYSTGCGSAATYGETVKAIPAAITGTTTVCAGATTTLADATAGGTWSSVAIGIATVNTTGVVMGIAVGTDNISYNANGCAVGVPVIVNSTPSLIIGALNICQGSSTIYTDATTGGTWMSSNAGVATINASGVATGLSAGTTLISYTTGCAPIITSITIERLPTSVSSTASLCAGSVATFSDSVSGGSWASSAPAVASIDAATGMARGLNAGTATISYSLINSCGSNIVTYGVAIAASGNWLGLTSNSWTDAGNWPCGLIPDVATNVSIPSGTTYAPGITGNELVKNFSVASGASVAISSADTINVKGNYTNNGSITGAGIVAINGTSAQVLSGTGAVNNLQINNNASVNSGDTVKVTTDLYLTSGTLTTNNGVELVSDASGTARIAPITGGAISGNVTVQQYITGGRRAYRFWAHPFSASIPLSQIEQYVDITGVGGVTNGFTATASNSPSAYWYNSINGNSFLGSDPGWTAFTSTNGVGGNAVKPFEGFRLYIRGTSGEGLDGTAYTPSDVTINMAGPVNTGSIAMTMLKGTSGYGDYNLLGNPYPSPVDIGTVIYNAYTAGHIAGAAFYVWNPYLGTSGQFVTQPITSSPYSIQTNNSFEVRTASNGNVLNFTESNKTDAASAVLLRTANNEYLTLNIYDTTYHLWDMMYVKFNEAATEAEDVLYDGVKPAGPASLNFYSLSSDSKQLSLDARPYAAGKVIPLGIKSSYAQQFIIKADEAAIPAGGQVYLYDNYLNQSTMLTEGAEYRFSITTDSMSQGNKRFELRMGNTESVAVQVANTTTVQMVPNPATDEVSIVYSMQTKGNVSLRLLNVAGITMQSQDLGNQQSGNAQLNVASLAAGIYMVELTCGNEKVVKRLVKE